MSPRARALIGIITAIFFFATGISLIRADQPALGALLLGLGLLRALYALVQARDAAGTKAP